MARTSKRKAQSSRRARHAVVKAVDNTTEVGGQQTQGTQGQIFEHCGHCGDLGHIADYCPSIVGNLQEVNQVQGGGRNFNMNSNTYHPGFQGNNQRSFNQPRYQGNQNNYQEGNEMVELLKSMQKELKRMNQLDEIRAQKDEVRDKAIHSLTTQMGQMAGELAELKKNPAHPSSSTRNVHINSVSLLSDCNNVSHEQEVVPPLRYKMGNLKKFLCERHFKEVKEEKWKNFEKIKINKPLLEVIKSSPAHTENLKELSTRNRHNKLPKQFDLTAHESAALSGTIPPKLQDPGAPLIAIQMGEVKVDRALLDLGACVSILPGRLYDQHDFGPLQKVDTTVVLANQKTIRPRGMLTDVIVKVEDCYYPVDFLVLDCDTTVESTQHMVILGRPFLATAHAVIDCANGTVGMRFGDRELSLNVFSNFTNSSTEEECFVIDRISVAESEVVEKARSVKKEVARKKSKSPRKKKVGDPPDHVNTRVEKVMFGPSKNEAGFEIKNWWSSSVGKEDCKHPTRPP